MKNTLLKSSFAGCILFLLVFFSQRTAAQNNVGIGTATPDASSIVDMVSTSKGMLVPRMTSLQRLAIASPANSLLVYDTDSMCYFFYRQPSSSWMSLFNLINGSARATT